jgi:hypothetical protein
MTLREEITLETQAQKETSQRNGVKMKKIDNLRKNVAMGRVPVTTVSVKKQ